MNFKSKFFSNIGWLKIEGTEDYITSLSFQKDEPEPSTAHANWHNPLIEQLNAYFDAQRYVFDLPLQPKGTAFQQKVWRELLKIPYGQTISYWELSQRLGDVKAIRAAASANGKNPIPLLIPCHRVIGKDGSLTGFSAGLDRKKYLLELEKGIQSLTLF